MSLHLGNISPRIRKDELEHVFRRFGRCTVQLKDGYGFAVFDFRGDAEKALRALKGRKICGELIYLSWSNKQPKPLKNFMRAGKSRESQFGRISGRVDDPVTDNFSTSHGGYARSNKRSDDGGVRHKILEIHDDRRSLSRNNIELELHHKKEEFLEDSYIEHNRMDNGRWGEGIDDLGNANGDDEEMGFDRYEPECADEREEYENRSKGHTKVSPSGERWLDNGNRVPHARNVRGSYTCFKCGAAGHKMHDCPVRGNSSNSHRRHDNETYVRGSELGDFRGPVSRSRERLQPSSSSRRRHDVIGKSFNSEGDGTNDTSSPVGDASKRTKTKDYNRKRQRERDTQIVEMFDSKRSKNLASSHRPSYYKQPQLGTNLKSGRQSPDSISHSRSQSPALHSLSAKSRLKIRSNQSSVKFKTRAGSSSPSLSPLTSMGQSLPSSPYKEEVDLNSSFDVAPDAQLKERPIEVWQGYGQDSREEKNSTSKKTKAGSSGYIDNSSCQLEDASANWQQQEIDMKYDNAASINHAEVSLNISMDDQIAGSQGLLMEHQQLEPGSRKSLVQSGDVPEHSEGLSSALEEQGDMRSQLHNNNGSSSIVPDVSDKIKIHVPSSIEHEASDIPGEKPSAEILRDVEEFENGNGLEMTKSLEPAYESDPEAPSRVQVNSPMSISAEELCTVLKHYGLKHPEDNEVKQGAEDYFGSARLWPWALIYYRRLKKGLVSVRELC